MKKISIYFMCLILSITVIPFSVNAEENTAMNLPYSVHTFYNGEYQDNYEYYADLAKKVEEKALELEKAFSAQNSKPDIKTYSTATADEDFDAGTVLVTLTHDQSIAGKEFTLKDFSGIANLKNIDNIMKLDPGDFEKRENKFINYDGYHQILSIELAEKSKENVIKAIKEIEQLEIVLSATPNYQVEMNTDSSPNDARYSEQYALKKINAEGAWSYTTGSNSTLVGVMDTGVIEHPDLVGNLVEGYDGYNDNNITTDIAGDGHGTKVAGVIGAVGNNSIGVTGICQDVSLVPLQVIDDDAVYDIEAEVKTLKYAASIGVPIINMSFGGYSEAEITSGDRYNAMKNYAGLFVCSAGNENSDNDIVHHYPSGYNLYNILSVAATDQNDQLCSFSNYGAVEVDLAAPGSAIYTTNENSDYTTHSGTSFAAPYVAGTAALIWSHYPDFTIFQVMACILNSVDIIPALEGTVATGGRLNAGNAMDLAAALTIKKIISGDFNGDGKDDIAALSEVSDVNAHTRILVNLSNGSEFTGWKTWYNNKSLYTYKFDQRFAAGDVNGDGKDDIVGIYESSSSNTIEYAYISNGSNFTQQNWTNSGLIKLKASKIGNRFTLGDFSGDGKADVAVLVYSSDTSANICMQTSSGTAFSGVAYSKTVSYNANNVGARFVSGNFDGNDKDDLAVMYEDDTGAVYIYTYIVKNALSLTQEEWRQYDSGSYDADATNGRFAAGDFNKDGKDDIAIMYVHPNSATMVLINVSDVHWGGDNIFTVENWYDWYTVDQSFDGNNATDLFVAGDFNGDGKDDIAYGYWYNIAPQKFKIHVHTSTGTTFNNAATWWTTS